MNTQLLKQLKGMMGKTYLYKGNQVTLKDYHIMGEEGMVQIDLAEGAPVKVKNFGKFIEECLPIDETNGERKEDESATSHGTQISTQVVEQTNGLLVTLQQTLLENIANVKKDKEYIKQANTINSSVNALIGMAKLQLQVGKLNGSKKSG